MSANSENVVRWGILGCGDVTEVKSGPALMKAARSRVDDVMRRDGAKAADYATRHGVPRWTNDANALISDPDLDAIYIATPPSTHARYAIECLKAGKNVLLEKPMALDSSQCDAIERAVEETGLKLSVAYYRRALPRFEKLRSLVTSGVIGEPRLIEVRHFLKGEGQPAQSWKVDPSVGGGGLFVDMQTHTLDWLAYSFGVPKAITGLQKRQAERYAAEDQVSYILDFGAFATMGLCAYATSEEEEKVIVHGSEGVASMGFFRPSAISVTTSAGAEEIELPDPAHVHQPFIERVLAYFLDDAPNPCAATDGRRSTDMVEKIFAGF